MRNDARPIGEKLRDIDEHAHKERGVEERPPERGRREESPRMPFVTDRDLGDEEGPGKAIKK